MSASHTLFPKANVTVENDAIATVNNLINELGKYTSNIKLATEMNIPASVNQIASRLKQQITMQALGDIMEALELYKPIINACPTSHDVIKGIKANLENYLTQNVIKDNVKATANINQAIELADKFINILLTVEKTSGKTNEKILQITEANINGLLKALSKKIPQANNPSPSPINRV